MTTRNTAITVAMLFMLSACATTGVAAAPAPAEDSGVSLSANWYEGRTWGGEIDVCVAAIYDASGCQWLAGLLIHSRCELAVYQTFASGLFMGAGFEDLYDDAVARGHCLDPPELDESAPPLGWPGHRPAVRSGGPSEHEGRTRLPMIPT